MIAITNLWKCTLLKPYKEENVGRLSIGIKPRKESFWDQMREIETIKRRSQASVDRLKKYTQNHRRPLELKVGDQVFLKVSPTRGVMKFGKKGKLSPRYVRSFEIIECIDEVTYQLAFLPVLSKLHDVFHVSVPKKYL